MAKNAGDPHAITARLRAEQLQQRKKLNTFFIGQPKAAPPKTKLLILAALWLTGILLMRFANSPTPNTSSTDYFFYFLTLCAAIVLLKGFAAYTKRNVRK